MTNPNNAIGTNGAYGGRTSVNALNDVLATFNGRGIVSGWAAAPSTGMSLTIGGTSGLRDVAIAEDNAGNRTTVNNISAGAVTVTLSAAPVTNNRIDAIVLYVANPPQGTSTAIDNPAACGLVVVSSAVAANPTDPTDGEIRAAITADGATGSTAYYVVVASVYVPSGVTTISANYITPGNKATLGRYVYQSNIGTAVTIPSTGDYHITAQTSVYNNFNGLYIQIKTSGGSWTTAAAAYNQNSNSWRSASAAINLTLAKGTQIRVCINNESTVMPTDGKYSQFGIFQIN